MRRQLNHPYLGLGLLLAIVLLTRWCPAQDWPDAVPGNSLISSNSPTSLGNLNRSVVPNPPIRPTPASRPASWPNAQAEASPWVPPDQRAVLAPSPLGELKPCRGTNIIARVGSEAILESEINGAVNEILERNKDKIPPEQWEMQREVLIKQRLKSLIETKLISLDAKRNIPEEGWPNIEKQLSKQFEVDEVEKLIKKSGLNSRRELDQKLRALGTSLEREKRAYVERILAQQWMRQQIKHDEEITYDKMVAYYHQHPEEFTHPARARWEELMVSYSKHSSKAAAYEAIARMGNQVVGGTPLAQVAKTGSDSVLAADGGQRDWTTKGSLVCKELDQALFSLPMGQLSPIIEGPRGFHIVRVVEREEASITSFLDAQVDIRQKILRERSEEQFREYMAQLVSHTPVWTIFDGDVSVPQLSERPQTPSRYKR